MKELSLSALFLFVLSLGSGSKVEAQVELTPQNIQGELYSTFIYGKSAGVAHPICNSLAWDKNDRLWVGTQDGLSVFDGQRFKTFRHVSGDGNSLSGNFSNDIFCDSENRIWINTVDNGIDWMDASTGRFHSLSDIPKSVGLYQQQFVELSKGNVLAIVQNQLFEFSRSDRWNVQELANKILDNESISCLAQGTDSQILIGCKSGRIYSYEGGSIELMFDLEGNPVESILVSDKKIWIGTYSGLFYCNAHAPGQIHGISEIPYHIYKIATGDGNIWIATGKGLYNVDEEDGTIHSSHLLNYTCFDLQLTQSDIWLATMEGLIQINRKPKAFYSILEDRFPDILKDEWGTASSISVTDEGVWMAFRGQGLVYITPDSQFVYNAISRNNNLSSYHLRHLCRDSKGYLWIGSVEGISVVDLNTFNPQSLQAQSIKIASKHEDIGQSMTNNTRHIYEDRDGGIWVATFLGGLFKWNGSFVEDEIDFEHYALSDHPSSNFPTNTLHKIQQDSSGKYWVASRDGLIHFTYNSQEKKIADIQIINSKDSSMFQIAGDVVYDVLVQSEKTLWVGTTRGVTQYIFDNKSTTHYRDFSNPVINAILPINQQEVFVATNDGLCLLNTSEDRIKCYGEEDGLPISVFEIFCSSKIDDDFLFGGPKGVIVTSPRKIEELDSPGKVVIAELVKSEQEEEKTAPLAIALDEELWVVDKGDFPITIKLADGLYQPNRNNQYYYKLKDQGELWIPLESKASITFPVLDFGEHEISIQAGKHGQLWGSPAARLRIYVAPPFYRSRWAYVVYAVLAMCLIWKLIQFRQRRLIQRMERDRQQELHKWKSNLFTNITHEFKTPLTVLQGIAQEMDENAEDSSTDSKKVKLLLSSAQRLRDYVDQLLALGKVELGELPVKWSVIEVVGFIRYLMEGFDSVAKQKGLKLHLFSALDELYHKTDEQHLTAIVSNLLTNAIKYTPAGGEVSVSLMSLTKGGDPTLTIEVKDNGQGISEEELGSIFNRYYRGSSTEKMGQSGAGIGLALTRELVDLLEGEITCKSELDKGSTFAVSFPVRVSGTPELVKEHIHSPGENSHSEVWDSASDESKAVVLIVEDNRDVYLYIESCLGDEFQVHWANDGIVGLDLAFRYIPDLILSDLMMPRMDGFEFCKRIKSDTRTDHIPIIMLTARSSNQDLIQSIDIGIEAFLTKPFLKDELTHRIDQILKLRQHLLDKLSDPSSTSFSREELQDPKVKFVRRCTELVLEHLDDGGFGVNELAQSVHLSPSQLYRKLKATKDQSATRFIRSIRLRAAKQQIERTHKSVSEIAYSCGFNEIAYFSRVFKEEFGAAPSTFRDKN